MSAVAKIATIDTLDELDGYEAEAKRRGITPDELRALAERRRELTPKRRKGYARHGRS